MKPILSVLFCCLSLMLSGCGDDGQKKQQAQKEQAQQADKAKREASNKAYIAELEEKSTNGDAESMWFLAKELRDKDDYRAKELLEQAIAKGYKDAEYTLGSLLVYSNTSSNQDIEKGLSILKKIANKKKADSLAPADAASVLEGLYRHGGFKGRLPKANQKEADKWAKKLKQIESRYE